MSDSPIADAVGQAAAGSSAAAEHAAGKAFVRKVADLLSRNGIDPDEVGRVQRAKVWQGFMKGEDGTPVVVDLAGVELSPAWAEGPAWPLPRPCRPVHVHPPRLPVARQKRPRGWELSIVLPDEQIGYRRNLQDVSELEPFHDEQAMAAALRGLAMLQPDRVLHAGDGMDFAELGRFEQEAGFVLTLQPAIDRGGRWYAQVRAACPNADHYVFEGNHDRRMPRAILNNARAAFGLKRAAEPDGWPVLSVPHLLRFDELGVRYVEGYPAGAVWLNDEVRVEHGINLDPGKTLNEERVSVVHGHLHRRFLQSRRFTERSRDRAITVASPGCLCRVDGAVPSTKSSTDSNGRMVRRVENWQQGITLIWHHRDGRHAITNLPIDDGVLYHPTLGPI